MRYFRKEVLANRLWFQATGSQIKWEPIAGGQGVYATEFPPIIAELDHAIAKHIGGVVAITESEYTEAKKKALGNPLLNNFLRDRPSLSGQSLLVPGQGAPGLVAVNVSPPPLRGQLSPHLRDQPKETPLPITVNTEFQRPKTGKVFKERSDAQ